VRAAAVKAMAGVGIKGQMYAADICRAMEGNSADVKIAAVGALASMGARGAAFADEVEPLAADQDSGVRIAALEALAAMGKVGKPFLLRAAKQAEDDALQEVRDVAGKVLADL